MMGVSEGIRDWWGTLVHHAKARHAVAVQGMCGDESLRPADSPILWTVDLEISYGQPVESIYLPKEPQQPTAGFTDPTDEVRLKITIGHARGRDDVPPKTCEIECEFGHLDNLAETLTQALMVARRDGLLPIVRGMKPWQVLIGEKVVDPRGRSYLYGDLKAKVDKTFKRPNMRLIRGKKSA